MSNPNVPAEDGATDDSDAQPTGDMTDPQEYGGLSVEDDPNGTVDPGELAGGANESDEDVS